MFNIKQMFLLAHRHLEINLYHSTWNDFHNQLFIFTKQNHTSRYGYAIPLLFLPSSSLAVVPFSNLLLFSTPPGESVEGIGDTLSALGTSPLAGSLCTPVFSLVTVSIGGRGCCWLDSEFIMAAKRDRRANSHLFNFTSKTLSDTLKQGSKWLPLQSQLISTFEIWTCVSLSTWFC